MFIGRAAHANPPGDPPTQGGEQNVAPSTLQPESEREISSTFIVSMVFLLALGAPAILWIDWSLDQKPTERPPLEVLANAVDGALEKNIRQAVMEGRAIRGMTKYDVQQAKGSPLRRWTGMAIEPEQRRAGVTEVWVYYKPQRMNEFTRGEFVCFGYEGTVLFVHDFVE